ncbi:MAG: hypothetical protein ACE5Z5_09840 [Candidatus Bathyarchaeia archaeon]
MGINSIHDEIAKRLAKKFKTRHRRKGVDLRFGDRAVEVAATDGDLYQSMGQLRRSRKPKKYLAVPRELEQRAKELTKGTGIGVMGPTGRILKRTRRKRR